MKIVLEIKKSKEKRPKQTNNGKVSGDENSNDVRKIKETLQKIRCLVSGSVRISFSLKIQ